MKKFFCHIANKPNLCPYDVGYAVRKAEYCPRCTLPELYSKKGKVPESHCEAANVGYEEPPEGKENELL